MDIEKVFKIYQDNIFTYFDQKSNIAIVLIDKNKKILDCNKGFLKILGLEEKPINHSLSNFISSISEEIFTTDIAYKEINVVFKITGDIEIVLKGTIFPLDNLYLMVFEQYRLTYDEILAKMSLLNDQIVDITRQLERKNRELSEALATIKRTLNTDPLTGILNRRAFKKVFKREISFAKRHRLPLSIVMIDLDHFKKINDNYGHNVGDYVLKTFTQVIRKSIRMEDIFARLGGEEFILLFPNTNRDSAFKACERIRQKVERTKFKGVKEKITASFGITELLHTDNGEDIIKRADAALYEAKRKGRNCCEIK